ncbi:MAG: serine/threonine protein phosphatase, partial [Bryobacteraceae bacterium]
MVRPCAWLAFLAPLFYLSYGFANWVTGLRGSVPSVVFGWESHIPFLAWTIVPYWSTNLLYAASLFVCRDRRELDTHGQRLLTVQILSVAGFLLFPLRFTFDRPETHGLFGAMFDALTSFDKPFNQAPSLHLCITAILWVKYSAHLNRVPLRLMQAWLVLTGLSTLTT